MASTEEKLLAPTENINTDNDINDIKQDVNEVLSESKRYVARMFVISVCQVFMSSSRHPIWILYAQSNQFDHPIHPSYHLISWVLYGGMFWKGIGSLFYVSIANKTGYDKGVILLIMLNVTAIFMETLTHNFIILSIGFFLSHTGITNVVFAAIAWLLPHRNAVKYTSLLNASTIIAYILGPGITGIVSKYLSFRWVFWINAIIASIVFLYGIVFVGINSQKKIEEKQLKIKYNKKTKREDKYPMYIKLKNEKKGKYSSYRLSRFEWIILLASIWANSLAHVSSVIMGFYYILFVTQNLKNANVLVGSIQLLLMSLGAIIGTGLAVKIAKKTMFLRYIIMLLTSAGYGCLMYFVYPNYSNINMWYLYNFFGGFMIGSFMMMAQTVMLEFQSASKAGYMYGFTAFIRSLLKASSLLFVGLYWNKYKYIMFYVMSISMAAAFILSLLMAICHFCSRLFKIKLHRNRSTTTTSIVSTMGTLTSVYSVN